MMSKSSWLGLVPALRRLFLGGVKPPKAKRFGETSTPTTNTYYEGMTQDYRWFRQDELVRKCLVTNTYFATMTAGFETILEPNQEDIDIENYNFVKEGIDAINKRVNLDLTLFVAPLNAAYTVRLASRSSSIRTRSPPGSFPSRPLSSPTYEKSTAKTRTQRDKTRPAQRKGQTSTRPQTTRGPAPKPPQNRDTTKHRRPRNKAEPWQNSARTIPEQHQTKPQKQAKTKKQNRKTQIPPKTQDRRGSQNQITRTGRRSKRTIVAGGRVDLNYRPWGQNLLGPHRPINWIVPSLVMFLL